MIFHNSLSLFFFCFCFRLDFFLFGLPLLLGKDSFEFNSIEIGGGGIVITSIWCSPSNFVGEVFIESNSIKIGSSKKDGVLMISNWGKDEIDWGDKGEPIEYNIKKNIMF